MKKLFIVMGLSLLSGALYAACVGPFCWDDTGASINATVYHNGPAVNYSQTSAQIKARTPVAKGEMFYCSNCTSLDSICISTGTGLGAYGHITSTGTACN